MPTSQASETSAKERRKDSHKDVANGSHNGRGVAAPGGHDYVVPVVHVSLPESAVNAGFWSVLVGSVVIGAVDLPLAALIGVGVLVARHRRSG